MKNSKWEKLLEKMLAMPRTEREEKIKGMSREDKKAFFIYMEQQTLTHKFNLHGKSYEEKLKLRKEYIASHPNEIYWDYGDYITDEDKHMDIPYIVSTNGDVISRFKTFAFNIVSNSVVPIDRLKDEVIYRRYKDTSIYMNRLKECTFLSPPAKKIIKYRQIKLGDKFGLYTVISDVFKYIKKKRGRFPYVLCRCACGNVKYIQAHQLLIGSIRSCGCLTANKRMGAWTVKHPLYRIWNGMRNRCNNPNNEYYHRYGGRGIKVCEDFNDFRVFLNLMHSTWKPGLTLDRIDVNGDYTFSNCRWATIEQQASNKRDTIHVVDPFTGDATCAGVLARRYGLSDTTISSRIKKGLKGVELLNLKTNYYNVNWNFTSDSERAAILKVIRNNSSDKAALLLNMKLIDVLIIKHYEKE